jgi:hypothetical protein
LTCGVSDACTTTLLADNGIIWPLQPKDFQHRSLGFDVGVGREVAASFVRALEDGAKAAAHDIRAGLDHGNGNFNVGHHAVLGS